MSIEYSTIGFGLAVAIAAIMFVAVPRILSIWRTPAAIRGMEAVAAGMEGSTTLFKYSPELDIVIEQLKASPYSKLRVAGDYLAAWRLRFPQETMNAKRKDIALPLSRAARALKHGDVLEMNNAFSLLPVEGGTPTVADAGWKVSLSEKLSTASHLIDDWRRSKWVDAARDLEEELPKIPSSVRPAIYLLKGYIEKPMKYTEVCLSEQKLKAQNSRLAQTISLLSKEIQAETVNPLRLWSILSEYGEEYRYPGRRIDC